MNPVTRHPLSLLAVFACALVATVSCTKIIEVVEVVPDAGEDARADTATDTAAPEDTTTPRDTARRDLPRIPEDVGEFDIRGILDVENRRDTVVVDGERLDGRPADAPARDTGEEDLGPDEPIERDTSPVDARRPDTTPIDSGGGPDTVGEDTTSPDTGPVVTACTNGPHQCPWGEGCVAGVCGACTRSDQCQTLDACDAIAGTCGRCGAGAPCRDGETCEFGFCVPEEMPRWELVIDERDFADMLADPYSDLEAPCSLTVDGVDYSGCEVRFRGGTSRDYPKKSFRVTLPRGSDHPGFTRRANLRSEWNDPSFLRSYLGYESMRRFSHELMVPRVQFVQLYLNGEYYGVMTEIERIGGDFLEHHGRSSARSMYEADPSRSLFADGVGSLVPLGDPELYEVAFDKKTGDEDDYSDLIHFVEDVIWQDFLDREEFGLGASTRRIRENLYVERYVDFVAGMAVIQNNDHIRKNYYMTHQRDRSGGLRWEFIPWDMDLSLGCLWEPEYDTICTVHVDNEDPFFGVVPDGVGVGFPVSAFYNLLMDLVVRDPEFYNGFNERLCGWTETEYWTREYPQLVDALTRYLRPYVQADARDRNETIADWLDAVSEVRGFPSDRAAFLRSGGYCPPP